VHRARLKSGEEVAVKIQYPGIARSIRDDVANIRALVLPMRLGVDGDSIRTQLKDIEEMMGLEVDYREEAENLRRARKTLSGLDEVIVPKVYDELSTQRILTMEWLEGVHLKDYIARAPSQADRDRFGSLMIRSLMRLCYSAHMLYSDLHPGNFVFMRDGRLGLIDFGCVRRYTPEDIDYLTEAEQAGFVSREAVRSAVIRGADLTDKQRTETERMDLMMAWYDWVCEPTLTDSPFDFSQESYFRRGMDLWRQLLRKRYVRTLPVNIWITKSFVGARAMLYRLGASVPLGKIMREETSVELPPVPGTK
jgi:predicted unusual protein kinase regulating ubiquinone biosynthesis (AarF/ABC1/UbiB family)